VAKTALKVNAEDDDEETRPKLLPSHLQSKESIESWLEDRKRLWRQRRQIVKHK